jgi:hypothetical protein
MKHWFFINSMSLHIWTYGSGDTTSGEYRYDTKDEFKSAIQELLDGGYELIKDQI